MSWLIPGDPRTHRWHLHRSLGKQELFSRMGAGFYHSINRKSGQPIEDGLSPNLHSTSTRLQCIRQAGKLPLGGERKGERHGND